MAATFPNGIASFPTHRNRLDDVDAADINHIQDEIIAIQQTLGPLITQVAEVHSDVEVVQGQNNTVDLSATEAEIAALQQSLEANTQSDSLNKSQNVIRFNNLDERLTRIEQGQHLPVANLRLGAPFHVAQRSLSQLKSDMGQPVALAPFNDPYNLYNGTGLTLTKRGFWLITGFVTYSSITANTVFNRGSATFQASIEWGGDEALGMDSETLYFVEGNLGAAPTEFPNVHLSPSRIGYFAAGAQIYLRTAHTSTRQELVSRAGLAALFIQG